MRSLVGFGLCAFLFVAACDGEVIGGVGADSGPGSPDASSDAPSTEASTDAPHATCCPIDPQPAGCMSMGGTNENDGASCGRTCDFFCSENWRIEKNANGCNEWKYDVRHPAPGEGPQCNPLDAGPSVDAGPSGDAGPDAQTAFACGTMTCSTATQYCFATYGGVQDTFVCKPLPTKCTSNNTCACIEPTEAPACGARPGLPTCAADNGGVTVGCSI